MRKIAVTAAVITIGFIAGGCRLLDYMDRPRPIVMRCKISDSAWVKEASDVFDRNGYTITEKDYENGTVSAVDSVEKVGYPYSALVRNWHVKAYGDSVVVHIWSVSTRLDDSDVTQTWDKRWSGETVKDWMRPVLTSLEAICGLGSPIRPGSK